MIAADGDIEPVFIRFKFFERKPKILGFTLHRIDKLNKCFSIYRYCSIILREYGITKNRKNM
jgi:hypothetical protein